MSVTKVTGMMQTGTKGGDIPSAGTMVIDTDGDYFDITGTTGITAMTVDAGRRFTLQFDGAVTLTHGASLYLPGAVNFTSEANDTLSFTATAANTVRCTGYALKDGGSPVYDVDTLKADTADVLTVGFAVTIHDAGTKASGTYTPDEANGNMQKFVNGGAHTLAPPANDCTLVLQQTNNASAGTITTSGFTLVDGDSFTTTDGHDFSYT